MNDLEAEQAIIAAIIKYGRDGFLDVCDIIDGDSFSEYRHAVFYNTFKDIFEGNNPPEKADGATFLGAASQHGWRQDIVDNKSYLSQLKSFDVDVSSVRRHAQTVKKNSIARELLERCHNIIGELQKVNGATHTLEQILSTVEKPIYDFVASLDGNNNGPQLLSDGLREYIDHLLNNPRDYVGIPSFCNLWNAASGGGYIEGQLSVYHARRGVGKSTFVLKEARHMAGNLGIPVLILDGEMTDVVAKERLLSAESSVKQWLIKTGKASTDQQAINKLNDGVEKVYDMPIYYYQMAGRSFDETLSVIRRWIARKVGMQSNGKANPSAIFYDYIKMNNSSSNSNKNGEEWKILGNHATELANLAIRFHNIVIGMVQSNQQFNISQSDRISWVANTVCRFYEPELDDMVSNPNAGNRRMSFEKSRFGPGIRGDDSICFQLDGDICELTELGLESQLKGGQAQVQTDGVIF